MIVTWRKFWREAKVVDYPVLLIFPPSSVLEKVQQVHELGHVVPLEGKE